MNPIRLRNVLLGAALAACAASAAHAQNSASVTTNSSITVFRPITISKTSDLSFGVVVRPNVGASAATVKVDQATTNCDRTVTGASSGVLLTTSVPGQSASSCAAFSVGGEGGQAFSIQVPANFNMTNGAATLQVILTPSALTASLGSTLGNAGTQTFKVGGTVQISDTTTSGQYTGSFTTTVQYN